MATNPLGFNGRQTMLTLTTAELRLANLNNGQKMCNAVDTSTDEKANGLQHQGESSKLQVHSCRTGE